MLRRVRFKIDISTHELHQKYKNIMGGFGIADNIRNYYRMNFELRKRKWWWYILFWAVVFILTNAYIIYICMHNMHDNTRKNILSHHDLERQ